MKTHFFVAVAILLAACAEQATPALPAAPQVSELRALLRARHPADFPTAETLARHPDVLVNLHDLAWHDDHLMVRRRAASGIGTLAPTHPEAEAMLVGFLADDVDAGVRAAALGGLARLNLAARADLRGLVEAQVFADDARVAYAAVAALGRVEASRPVLVRALSSPAVAPEVRSLASLRLGGEALPAQPLVIHKRVR